MNELLQRAADGDQLAAQQLVEVHAAPLRRYLDRQMGRHLRRAISAADLSQEVFVRMFAALRRMPDDADLRTFRRWLYRHADWVLQNHGNAARALRGESAVVGTVAEPATPPLSQGQVTTRDEIAWLSRLLERLDEKYAVIVRLRLEGHDFRAIGRHLGLEEATVRQRFSRVLRVLREQVRSGAAVQPPQ